MSSSNLLMLLSVGQCELVIAHQQCEVLQNILFEKIDRSYNQVTVTGLARLQTGDAIIWLGSAVIQSQREHIKC